MRCSLSEPKRDVARQDISFLSPWREKARALAKRAKAKGSEQRAVDGHVEANQPVQQGLSLSETFVAKRECIF
ncbi:hypothetical protein A2U01_0061169 [Trifolium medium]|uniref:Uncharacterized protein n=1 Tax=Trifolium medium TaxID=97028 RepID=A0A392RUV9_9FABA|nr:hypothetical protein [Trifolium medium]